jgi:sec-independent protein translocase protein TatC
MAKKKQKTDSDEMGFLEHLEELRWHLIRAFIAIVLLGFVAFIFKDIVFDQIIMGPKSSNFFTNRALCNFGEWIHIKTLCINSKPFEVINIKMAGQFLTHIMVSIIAGIIVGFPYLFFEFWKFISPALHKQEKKYSRGAVFFTSLLFMLGVLFGYYVICPLSVHFLGSYSVSEDITNKIHLTSYISTVASVTLASGILFELPVLVFFLTKIGLITPEILKKYRRHSLVAILALSAIITPPDIFSQILVAFPLLFLYEGGIIISRRIINKEQRQANA